MRPFRRQARDGILAEFSLRDLATLGCFHQIGGDAAFNVSLDNFFHLGDERRAVLPRWELRMSVSEARFGKRGGVETSAERPSRGGDPI